jgi:hypothetical protein
MPALIYHYHRLGEDRILRYACSGQSLGTGRLDLGFIVDGLSLFEAASGDVIEIGDYFVMLDGITGPQAFRDPSFVEYHYLPFFEDHDHLFGDGPWSPTMIARLRREAQGAP